ncbi:MspA family porin [Nocardia sp. NBC_00881]|uniref:MspA family porin n=1 Tax=Nocardia sp. NBC_00881 TaxID=2975995 RepID=UPI0038674A1F|nr:MspA family porin [Nocardia sp. NBC_00881]
MMRSVAGFGRLPAGIGLGLAVLMFGCGVAQADTVVPLPDGKQDFTTATGVQIELSRTGESAVVSPSLAYNGLSRTASMSGTVYATVAGATGGTLVSGYLIGCQADLSGGVTVGGDVYVAPGSVSPELAPSINLVPGGVAQVKFDTKQIDPRAGAVGFEYHDRGVQVDGCAGYAQARAFTTLTVTDQRGSAEVTLYGDPFSIG